MILSVAFLTTVKLVLNCHNLQQEFLIWKALHLSDLAVDSE